MASADESYPDEYRTPASLGTRGVTLDLVLGTPTTGLWCDTCLLPSRYEIPLYTLSADGPIQFATFNRCDGHQS